MGHADEPAKKQTCKHASRTTSRLNPQTGVVSTAASNFSAENWGQRTRSYAVSINNMKTEALEEIVAMATPQMSMHKSRRQSSMFDHLGLTNGDVRACLLDIVGWYVLSRSVVF